MSDLPSAIHLREVGPREGLQFEKRVVPTEDKVRLVDALSDTGMREIEFASFVSPKWVPQMADAEAWTAGIRKAPGVQYEGIWLNLQGFERALKLRDVLTLRPSFAVPASSTFWKKNANRTIEEQLEQLPAYVAAYRAAGFDHLTLTVGAAWGCNYEGAIPPERVVALLDEAQARASELGMPVGKIGLMDTMGWANPLAIKRLVGLVRDRWPDLALYLHLHDTRGTGIANFVAALEMGVTEFDTAVGGMGGCPFAEHKGAAGNVCSEDAVFICQEMGVATGIDLDRLIEAAQLAEEILGTDLPGKVKRGGNLARYRARAASAATG
ncbi:MAG TPA: hydroxymethylglutaryl-CoA lyase [Chloroflexota bacterium]|nr:hydroxymethylglutaryl-CoA lyase [Chloroflexota bacterium]